MLCIFNSIPMSMMWNRTVVLIYISLRTNIDQNFFLCLLVTCISSLEKYVQVVCLFLIGLPFCCQVIILYIFWILGPYQIRFVNICSYSLGSLNFLNHVLWCTYIFKYDKLYYFLLLLLFLVIYLKNYCLIDSHKDL